MQAWCTQKRCEMYIERATYDLEYHRDIEKIMVLF